MRRGCMVSCRHTLILGGGRGGSVGGRDGERDMTTGLGRRRLICSGNQHLPIMSRRSHAQGKEATMLMVYRLR